MTSESSRSRASGGIVGLLVLALFVACVASAAASTAPDGMAFVAETAGFASSARDSVAAASPLAEYAVPNLPATASTAIVGAVGCSLVFGVAMVASRAASVFRRSRDDQRGRK